ncbi:hypothetical protein F5148DRAFT_1190713 [Russula earlei]|uniref:Uncharacterized protein n=1 Tax=Russula earlei TaxID=71964 RepID=A0ACC0UDX0_9AGAM|nr:hypothetical protein F5148DRAFT_1190713 [Russula earlei]
MNNGRDLWEGPANSICQLIIILLANMFLAVRIRTLTESRFQSGLVVVLSILAFIVGMITVVTAWRNRFGSSTRRITSVVWHALQALAECLITFFLVRMFMRSRSGIRRSDTVLNYLARSVIQTGCLATTWAIGALVTWFFLPSNMIYRVFDLTSGTVYTHAIFDTLISRVQLREQLSTTIFELGYTRQDRPPRSARSSRAHTIGRDDAIELKAISTSKSAALTNFKVSHQGQ